MRSIAITVALAACYSPQPHAGTTCGPGDACPSGLTCSAATQTCELHAVDAPGPRDATLLVDVADDGALLVDAPLPIDAPRQWALVQTQASDVSPLTITASGQGNLMIVAIQSAAAVASVSDNTDNNTYVAVPAARCDAPGLGLEIWYAANTAPGATNITVGGPSTSAVVAWEVSGMRLTQVLDDANAIDDQAASTTPDGAMVTTGAAGEFVVSAAMVANDVTGIHTGNEFTNDHRTKGNGWAHLTDPAAPAGSHQAEWDQTTAGIYCSSIAAFVTAP